MCVCVYVGVGVCTRTCVCLSAHVCVYIYVHVGGPLISACVYVGWRYLPLLLSNLFFRLQSLLLNLGLTAGLDTALLRSVYASPVTSIEVQVHATMPIFYLGSGNPILAVHPMPQALFPLSHPVSFSSPTYPGFSSKSPCDRG